MFHRKKESRQIDQDTMDLDIDFLAEEDFSEEDPASSASNSSPSQKKGRRTKEDQAPISPDTDTGPEGTPPRKKLPSWVILPILAVIIAAAFGLSALTQNDNNTNGAALNVTTVKTGNIREVYNSSGTIESENTKTYYSPVTAPITNLNAAVGKEVKNGDLLVTFDTTALERDNQQAQLTLRSSLNTSDSTRQKNAQAVAAAIDAANAANAQLADQANALADEYNRIAAQAEEEKARLDADYAQKQQQFSSEATQTRIQELNSQIADLNSKIPEYEQQEQTLSVIYTGSGPAYQAAKAKQNAHQSLSEDERKLIENVELYLKVVEELPVMKERLNADTAELNSLQTLNTYDDSAYQALIAQRDAAYNAWEAAYKAATGNTAKASDTGMTSSELENLNISDNLAELAALTPEELLQKGREGMKADMDGVVASVDIVQTNSAVQGSAVFSIASTENVRIKLEVSPDDYEKMRIGNAVSITVGANKYEGTLSKIDKIAVNNAKGNPVINAFVHISNPDQNICIGATAKISMTVAESDHVLVIPTETINASTDGDFVFVIENGVVKKKPVELGNASTTQVEVVSGLKEGDLVVNDLNVDISEGMKATALPQSDENGESTDSEK